MKKDTDYSINWKLRYASGKLGLIPAFGDGIGREVNKAELALAKKYVEQACNSHAALVSALENAGNVLAALATGQLNEIKPDSSALAQIRAALALAKGGQL